MWPSYSEISRTTARRLLLCPNVPPAQRLRSPCAAGRLLLIKTHRPSVSHESNQEIQLTQRRCITLQHIRRMKEAEKEWSGFAEEIKEGKRKSFVEHLEERGLIHQVVGERDLLHKIFTEKRTGLYAGVDPTAPSLHVGHMLPFMVLAWAYVWGLKVTFLLGGATAKFGDPTGRLTGREPMHRSVRTANMASMHIQLKRIGKCIEMYGIRHGYESQWIWRRALTNNNAWWNKTPFTDVLRDLGSYMRLGPMLGRDTVKTRLEGGEGMSFAEFSYPLMQAWDWWELFKRGHQVQVGGSDQFGNILFGMDAVKALAKNTAIEQDRRDVENDIDKPIGLTTPLLLTSSGEKFGKSAGNAIWLDKDLTSTFDLYQFFVRTADADVERYLKMFTFLSLEEISSIMKEQNEDPSQRVAQHTLAREFVELVHGPIEAQAASLQHRQLFRSRSSTATPTPPPMPIPKWPESFARRPESQFLNAQAGNKYAPHTNYANMPGARATLPRSLINEQQLHKVLYNLGLVSSNNEGHRLIANRGAYVGSRPGDSGEMSDALEFTPILTWPPEETQKYIMNGDLLVIKVGKWKFKIVNIIDDEEFDKRGLKAPGWEEFKDKKLHPEKYEVEELKVDPKALKKKQKLVFLRKIEG